MILSKLATTVCEPWGSCRSCIRHSCAWFIKALDVPGICHLLDDYRSGRWFQVYDTIPSSGYYCPADDGENSTTETTPGGGEAGNSSESGRGGGGIFADDDVWIFILIGAEVLVGIVVLLTAVHTFWKPQACCRSPSSWCQAEIENGVPRNQPGRLRRAIDSILGRFRRDGGGGVGDNLEQEDLSIHRERIAWIFDALKMDFPGDDDEEGGGDEEDDDVHLERYPSPNKPGIFKIASSSGSSSSSDDDEGVPEGAVGGVPATELAAGISRAANALVESPAADKTEAEIVRKEQVTKSGRISDPIYDFYCKGLPPLIY